MPDTELPMSHTYGTRIAYGVAILNLDHAGAKLLRLAYQHGQGCVEHLSGVSDEDYQHEAHAEGLDNVQYVFGCDIDIADASISYYGA